MKPGAFRPSPRGTAFKESKEKGGLYLDFAPTRVIALRPNGAMAWLKRAGGSDTRFIGVRDVDIDVAALIREVRADEAWKSAAVSGQPEPLAKRPHQGAYFHRRRQNFRRFLAEVPRGVQDETMNKWSGMTWPLLRLLIGSVAAREVCASGGHALVYALAMAHTLRDMPQDTLAFARRWLARPRREICGRLGFPRTQAAVGVMAKVPRDHLSPRMLELLKTALADDTCRQQLCHAPRVTRSLATALQPHLVKIVGPRLIEQLAHDDDATGAAADGLGLDLRDVEALMQQTGTSTLITSRIQLRNLHHRLMRTRRSFYEHHSGVFGAPPVDLSADPQVTAVALTTTRALVAEGAAMHHCLGTIEEHHALAAQGRFFAWAVHAPERLTLALAKMESTWELYDLRAPTNALPTPVMKEWADRVVDRANGARAQHRFAA